MATNATAVDDSKTVTEEDLKNDKLALEVETAKTEDESKTDDVPEESEETSEEDGQTDTPAEEETPAFVKQVPSIAGDTEEEYLKNLETAYQASTTEALRLKGLADQVQNVQVEEADEVDLSDPLRLYAKQQMDKDIQTAFAKFGTEYPQVNDPAEYNKFTSEVSTLSQTIMSSQKRLASPEELYSKAAIILGWDKDVPDGKDKLGNALKDRAATPKTTSATSSAPKSKVSDEVIQVNKLMYPDKSEAQIREELEPYVK